VAMEEVFELPGSEWSRSGLLYLPKYCLRCLSGVQSDGVEMNPCQGKAWNAEDVVVRNIIRDDDAAIGFSIIHVAAATTENGPLGMVVAF